MEMKMHASGFDSTMTDQDEREKFIQECDEMFGIKIDQTKMEKNPSKRTLSKLLANSNWGKFAENDNLTKTITTDSPAILRQLLDNPKIEVASITPLNEQVLLISYKSQKDFCSPNRTNNVAIAAWTTSIARLKLLEALQAVHKAEEDGTAVPIYCDTDSVIYAIREGFPDPLKFLEGPHLGQMKDEKEGYEIMEVSSCGPKSYAEKLKNEKTGEIVYEMKVKGITLDYNTCQLLQYETFKEKCLNFGEVDEEDNQLTVNYDGVLRPDVRTGNVYTVPLRKKFRPVIRKGIVDEHYRIREFGFSDC